MCLVEDNRAVTIAWPDTVLRRHRRLVPTLGRDPQPRAGHPAIVQKTREAIAGIAADSST
ncbi:MAG: hypothetical protein IPM29_15185 [Planctomycetes bacterium]|nr:hypothetical protein [Planctomycetota bacterium]